MTEQVWWAAGARLPIVMCIANRAMAAPWNVLNDQQDSMSVRDAGWVQLYCRDNQEILDTTVQAYRIAEQLHVPVMVCYDGFLLSHTVMPVEVPDRRDGRRVPAAVHEPAARSSTRPTRATSARSPSPTRAPTATATMSHGYMEIRALHHRALLDALEAIPAVDAEWGAATGRAWGGLTWEHLLDDAEVVLVAAGSLGTQLTLVAEQLRAEGVKAGVLGVRCLPAVPRRGARPRSSRASRLALVFDKAMSYGYEGPICSDLRGALLGVDGAPAVCGAVCGLGGRDVTPADLADAVARAVADLDDGVRERAADWINLQLGRRCRSDDASSTFPMPTTSSRATAPAPAAASASGCARSPRRSRARWCMTVPGELPDRARRHVSRSARSTCRGSTSRSRRTAAVGERASRGPARRRAAPTR